MILKDIVVGKIITDWKYINKHLEISIDDNIKVIVKDFRTIKTILN